MTQGQDLHARDDSSALAGKAGPFQHRPVKFHTAIVTAALSTSFATGVFAACTGPAAGAGAMVYASNFGTMAYCDGATWISMAGGVSTTINNGGSAAAGGTSTQIQYNSSGTFAGDSGLTWNGTTLTATNLTAVNTLTAVSIVGTMTTAAQPNITSLGTLTGLSVNGAITTTTLTASSLVSGASGVFGSLTVGGVPITGNALGDRIVSGSLLAVANSATGYISLSTAGTTWGYLASAASYLPNLSSNVVSSSLVSATNTNSTNVSLTNVYFGPTNITTLLGGGGDKILSGTTVISTTNVAARGSAISFATAGSTVMTISGSNVGIGTSNPNAKLEVNGVVSGSTIQAAGALYSYDGTTSARVISSGGASYWGNTSNHPMLFQTNNAERMRIDASGNVGVGTANPVNAFDVQRQGSVAMQVYDTTNSRGVALTSNQGGNTAAVLFYGTKSWQLINGSSNMFFYNATDNTYPMYINSTGNVLIGGTLTQNSDARLKTNIKPINGALEKLAPIHGVTFNWKAKTSDPQEQMGVIAQDVQKTLPQLVTANASGTLSVNYSGMVAPMIEALKELKAESDNLRTSQATDHAAIQLLKQQIDSMQGEAKR